ncbi:MAG TPA: cytochrome c3 family protein [Pararhizobium sp.]|nr:cytochrome c3 family protein [Pararhizobium sp.]
MGQIFRPRATTFLRLALAAIPFVFAAVIGFGYQIHATPFYTDVGFAPEQPVPFSHKHHVGGLGLDCRYCHTSVENAAFAGMPPTATCMTCHSQLWTNAPMLEPVRASLREGKPIRWNRVYQLPDYVYFDHAVHVNNGVGCSSCHGDMTTQPLTMRKTPLTMGWCLSCHRAPGVHLRPADEIFDPHVPDPHNGPERAKALLHRYLIKTQNMTNCYVCHR